MSFFRANWSTSSRLISAWRRHRRLKILRKPYSSPHDVPTFQFWARSDGKHKSYSASKIWVFLNSAVKKVNKLQGVHASLSQRQKKTKLSDWAEIWQAYKSRSQNRLFIVTFLTKAPPPCRNRSCSSFTHRLPTTMKFTHSSYYTKFTLILKIETQGSQSRVCTLFIAPTGGTQNSHSELTLRVHTSSHLEFILIIHTTSSQHAYTIWVHNLSSYNSHYELTVCLQNLSSQFEFLQFTLRVHNLSSKSEITLRVHTLSSHSEFTLQALTQYSQYKITIWVHNQEVAHHL